MPYLTKLPYNHFMKGLKPSFSKVYGVRDPRREKVRQDRYFETLQQRQIDHMKQSSQTNLMVS